MFTFCRENDDLSFCVLQISSLHNRIFHPFPFSFSLCVLSMDLLFVRSIYVCTFRSYFFSTCSLSSISLCMCFLSTIQLSFSIRTHTTLLDFSLVSLHVHRIKPYARNHKPLCEKAYTLCNEKM